MTDIQCKKCGGVMKPSKALENNLSGVPDFYCSNEMALSDMQQYAKVN